MLPAVKLASRAFIVSLPLFLLVWIVAGLLDPHYSFRTGHGSDLALGSVGWLMTLNFIVVGLLEATFGGVLISRGRRVLGILVLAVGAGLALSGVFPEDAQGHAVTTPGSIHNGSFALTFLAIVIAAAYSAVREGGWWRTYSSLTTLGVLGGTAGFLIAGSEPGDPLYPVSGFLQLLLAAIAFAWVTLLAVRFSAGSERTSTLSSPTSERTT